MRHLPSWMPSLLRQINWGCSNSSILSIQDDTVETFQSGRKCCRELWYFIQELPANIAAVRDALPSEMDAAKSLLNELADDERIYQGLFIKQCQLAGLNIEELKSEVPSSSTQRLCEVMRHYCLSSNYHDGILAIVTAELAATAFCRSALPLFERYFEEFGATYSQTEIQEGLEWLLLHTKPHTKHALWLKRMLGDLDQDSADMPEPVQNVLQAVFSFLQCSEPLAPTGKKDLSLVQQ